MYMEQHIAQVNLQNLPNLEVSERKLDYSLVGYEYELPTDLIAQNPVVPRDSSRLLVVNSPHTGISVPPLHHMFHDLPELLKPGDLLVMNNTKVIPSRLYGYTSTGTQVEVLFLEERQFNCWLALVKPGKHFKLETKIIFEIKTTPPSADAGFTTQLTATVIDMDQATGGLLLMFDVPDGESLRPLLDQFGEVPVSPYITFSQAADAQYQTIYAEKPGSITVPTAGLHFTTELLQKLSDRQINQTFVTLHVGIGTFRPVEVEDVTTHQMHSEWIEVTAATVEQIRATKAAGGRVIAVGTTVVRALEAAAQNQLQAFVGKTNLFIYPGYQLQVVDGLITNFHLPRSSLMMLVSSLIGRTRLLNIYQEAIASRYRFYSFGDAMLILPEGKGIS